MSNVSTSEERFSGRGHHWPLPVLFYSVAAPGLLCLVADQVRGDHSSLRNLSSSFGGVSMLEALGIAAIAGFVLFQIVLGIRVMIYVLSGHYDIDRRIERYGK